MAAHRDRQDGLLVIGVDSSTSATKALVVDTTGDVLASGRAELTTTSPQIGRYEQDPASWVESLTDSVSDALSGLDHDQRARIRALAISTQRQTFCLTREDGTALTPGIVWLDTRAAAVVEELAAKHPWLHRRSGFQPDVTPSLYKLAWLARHQPELVAAADRVTGVHGALVHALTRRWVDSAASADSLALFDMARLTFDDELVALAGLRAEQLSDLVPPGGVCGHLTPAWQQRWGLSDVAVIAGCGDGQAAALGCAAVDPSVAYVNLGTAVVAGVDSPGYRVGASYRTDAAGLVGHYVLEVVQNSGTHLTDWFRRELGDPALAGAPDPGLDAAAARVPVGADGLLVVPYLDAVQSPHWNPHARGTITGLTTSHTRAHLYRAVLEGICVELARNLAALELDTGTRLTELRVVGGGRKSPLWLDILTHTTGVPVCVVDEPEVSALGVAALAIAHVTGEDVTSVVGRLHNRPPALAPDPARVHAYEALSERQRQLYDALD